MGDADIAILILGYMDGFIPPQNGANLVQNLAPSGLDTAVLCRDYWVQIR